MRHLLDLEARHIPGYEGLYLATKSGRIFSLRTQSFIKPHLHKGYLRVSLYDRLGRRKNYDVHRLVAMAWVPNPAGLPVVHHKDGNKLNNRADNLEWATVRENTLLAVRRGRMGGRRKLRMEDALNIRRMHLMGFSISSIARHYGMSKSTIWCIVNYRTYTVPRRVA